jgi:hypothetical protein
MLNGNPAQPQYTTLSGIVLDLQPISALILNRYRMEWRKANPAPIPPVKTLENGDAWHDTNDPWYQGLKAAHDEAENSVITDFVLQYGVLNNPPADWQNPFPLDGHPRLLWLMSILEADELATLFNGIMGLKQATVLGIETAEKK